MLTCVDGFFVFHPNFIELILHGVLHMPNSTLREKIEVLLNLRLVNRQWNKLCTRDVIWGKIFDQLHLRLDLRVHRPMFDEVIQRTFWGEPDNVLKRLISNMNDSDLKKSIISDLRRAIKTLQNEILGG